MMNFGQEENKTCELSPCIPSVRICSSNKVDRGKETSHSPSVCPFPRRKRKREAQRHGTFAIAIYFGEEGE
jgi:hypothetical protein